ncbi:hypothetical protein N665_0007s0033 [Sinapis alba]|nr:hypothetical protein N665_0007s0033 [Sinapis alba]
MMAEENNPMEGSCNEEFVCGDPKVDIPVGDEYQAEIPHMISDSKRAAFLVNPLASDLGSGSFVVGLPIQVTWIDTKFKDRQDLRDDHVDMGESLKSLKNKRSRRGEGGRNRGTKQRMSLEAVPEKPSSSWEDLEVDGFVLGLYTFGKNLTQVKKLLESKETGEILSFYYGKFYKSAKHKIWSNSPKKQSRKCIQGKKLYSGWRLQHLLSRLIPNITDKSQKKIFFKILSSLDVFINCNFVVLSSSMFIVKFIAALCVANLVGKHHKNFFTNFASSYFLPKTCASLAMELSFAVKSPIFSSSLILMFSNCDASKSNLILLTFAVPSKAFCSISQASLADSQPLGLPSLVEAVAISKDEDLTILTTEPVKSKQLFIVSSAGLGAYTSLTSEEIIEKLDDIFWEAVWPRLLARGWHSEQPKDIKSKDNIVFLIPGVEKFSRRKLVKQNHYFDSISDILKKVVAEPELLEFETKDIRPSNGFIEENNYQHSKQEKRCYLRSPDPCSNHMKFTAVDTTSLASGGKLCAFRELKNPDNNPSVERSQMMPLEQAKFSGECKWEKKEMKRLVEETVRFMIVDTNGHSSGIRRRRHLPDNENLCKVFGDPSPQNQSGTNSSVTWEYPKLSGSGVKEHTLENVGSNKRSVRKSESFPLTKRRQLSTCVRKDIERFGEIPKLSVELMNINTEESEETEIEIRRLKTEPNGLCLKKQEALQEVDLEASKHQENPIQLPSMPGSKRNCLPTQEIASIKQEKEEELNQQRNTDLPRRQSTRNRPLMTRALEALESEYYTAESMKCTSKPIKRKRSITIKHSAQATQGESDNGFVVKETTSSKAGDSERSFLADKATNVSKHVDQTEDSNKVTTESPKRPPILLKFPFKRR